MSKSRNTICRSLAILALSATQLLAAEHRVFLEDNAGARLEIAQLSVSEDSSYSVSFSDTAFTDHFLSMRPFKCLEGPDKHWCHVPYPYEIKRNISQDLIDLEYDFVFLWKGATDYGIDTWNGVYYRLQPSDQGWVGTLHEVDLGELGIPPEAGNLRPIGQGDLHEADAESHWLPRLVIE